MKQVILTLTMAACAACSFAQGGYMEFRMTNENNAALGNVKIYMQDGNSRSEISIAIPQMPGGELNMTSLSFKDSANAIYMLDDKTKTYTKHFLTSQEGKEYAETEYEITVIGKEKVNGYNATHIKVVGKKYKTEQEMWTSTEVKNYESYKGVRTKYMNEGLFKAMKEKGVDGFPVRIRTTEQSRKITLDLVKSEVKNNPTALFSVAGYTKSSSKTPAGVPTPQQIMEQMKSMTPEQKQEMMKKMREQYGVGNTGSTGKK